LQENAYNDQPYRVGNCLLNRSPKSEVLNFKSTLPPSALEFLFWRTSGGSQKTFVRGLRPSRLRLYVFLFPPTPPPSGARGPSYITYFDQETAKSGYRLEGSRIESHSHSLQPKTSGGELSERREEKRLQRFILSRRFHCMQSSVEQPSESQGDRT